MRPLETINIVMHRFLLNNLLSGNLVPHGSKNSAQKYLL